MANSTQNSTPDYLSSLSQDQQTQLTQGGDKSVLNQFGGNVLGAAKYMGYINPTIEGGINSAQASGTPITVPQNGQLNNTSIPAAGQTQAPPAPVQNPAGTATNAGAAGSNSPYAYSYGTDQNQTPQQQMANKYNQTLSSVQTNGGQAPTTQGAANATIAQNTPPPQPAPYDSTKADEVLAQDQAHQQYLQDYNQATSSQAQNESFTQQYSDLTKQLGISGMNTQLMNMKNIIDGTEDDIRNEIAKSGGFATESQVMAMSTARNKTMIQNYNNLLQTRDDMMKQVDTMMNLSQQDRAYAKQQIDQKLNFDQQQMQFADKAVQNAQDSLTSMQKTQGWDNIYKAALASGDPHAIARINSIMGPGFDLASAAQQDYQARQVAQNKADLANQQAEANLEKTKMENANAPAKNAADLAKTKAETAKTYQDIAKSKQDMEANTPGTPAYNKNQDKLEQEYRQVLVKELSNRSGGLGLQDQKVNQAIHLKALADSYKDAKGNYNVPKAQYAELVIGLANLLSPTGTVAEADRRELMSKTAGGDIKGAIQYITGTPQTGNTQAIIKNLVDSIDRQGNVSEGLRNQSVDFLQGLAPTGLDADRKAALEKNTLASYKNYGKTPNNTTKSGASFDYAKAKAAGYTDEEITSYLNSH